MQVSDANNVKIYNLSAGKSLPAWLTDRKKRALLKKNVDIRRRIELIQDFDMPGVSNCVRVTKDKQYIMVAGIYKPRIKCFEVNNLSLKFERCFDSEAISFEMLSDDYSKFILLQCDRYIEFHAAHGRYHRLRVPKFGRDMKYHLPSCDLFVVGASSEIYRVNLERGSFMTPFSSACSSLNKCDVNPEHHLLVCGSQEGKVEAFDPRVRNKVGTLDCAFSCFNEVKQLEVVPAVTALKFHGALNLGVGTSTGQVLLYDIRSNKPFFVKDHMYNLPIKDVDFHHEEDLVYSLDSSVLKIWSKTDGKLFTSIESTSDFNNLCVVPNTGMLFIANESPKVLTYYIPSLGPAPKWAGFLDSLTEELEETNTESVYDDYKFVTKEELESLGLEHLLGTNLLRAYMHGYFMDIRLYRKAKSVSEPFEFEQYRKKKIREKIEQDRVDRLQISKLPKVNRLLAMKLMETQLKDNNKRKKEATNLLSDDRFKKLFEDPNFEVDINSEEYRLINPVVSMMNFNKKMVKKISTQFKPVDDEPEGKASSEENSDFDESSDDEAVWSQEVKKQHRMLKHEEMVRDAEERRQQKRAARDERRANKLKLYELRPGEEFKGVADIRKKPNKSSLGERLEEEQSTVRLLGSVGNREMTFSTKRPVSKNHRLVEERNKKHREERRKLVRPATGVQKKTKKFFKRKKF